MSEVTKPLALDETLQQVVDKLGNISSVTGKSAYQSAQSGGFTGTEAQFNSQIATTPSIIRPNLLDNWCFVGGGGLLVPSGTTYYTTSALSTSGGTTSEDLIATVVYSSYATISVSGTTRYVARSALVTGAFPVNQKMIRSASSTEAIFFDRWLNSSLPSATISTACISLLGASDSVWQRIEQHLEHAGKLNGKKVTGSMIYRTTSTTAHIALYNRTTATYVFNITLPASNDYTLAYASAVVPANTSKTDLLQFLIYPQGGAGRNQTIDVQAAKLELGDTQTLAHNEGSDENPVWVLNEIPNYTDELLKCQRYYQLFSSSSYRPTYAKDFRPEMRADPSRSTVTVAGTTMYYADANL